MECYCIVKFSNKLKKSTNKRNLVKTVKTLAVTKVCGFSRKGWRTIKKRENFFKKNESQVRGL